MSGQKITVALRGGRRLKGDFDEKSRDLSRERESSEQFVWYGETETQLRHGVKRFKWIGDTLNKIFPANLEKALTFLDDKLLPAKVDPRRNL